MSVMRNISKKGLNLVVGIFKKMNYNNIRRLVIYNAIKTFFLNEEGSIHDLLERVNSCLGERHGFKPIGLRAVQKTLKQLKKEKKLDYITVKPTPSQLSSKYGTPIPDEVTYTHINDAYGAIKLGFVKFLQLKEGFVFNNSLSDYEKSLFDEVVKVLEKNQTDNNEVYSEIIDLLNDSVFHDLVVSQKIMGAENNSYKKGYNKIKEALLENKPLIIDRSKKEGDEILTIEFHPHFLKFYKNKWYAFGYSPEPKKETYVLPIDTQIKNIRYAKKKFVKCNKTYLKPNGSSDFFDEIIGVTNFREKNVQEIKLKIHTKDRFWRLKLNRIHHSMVFDDSNKTITLFVKTNKELENFIMEHADEIEVISPIALRKKIIKKIKKASEINQTNL